MHTCSGADENVSDKRQPRETFATFFGPNLADKLLTVDLIATSARQLQRHEDDLVVIHSSVVMSYCTLSRMSLSASSSATGCH